MKTIQAELQSRIDKRANLIAYISAYIAKYAPTSIWLKQDLLELENNQRIDKRILRKMNWSWNVHGTL